MRADAELSAALRALKRKWLYLSTDESDHANALFHECSSSEAGSKCRGREQAHIECANEIEALLKQLES